MTARNKKPKANSVFVVILTECRLCRTIVTQRPLHGYDLPQVSHSNRTYAPSQPRLYGEYVVFLLHAQQRPMTRPELV